jgi:hypothetical protein
MMGLRQSLQQLPMLASLLDRKEGAVARGLCVIVHQTNLLAILKCLHAAPVELVSCHDFSCHCARHFHR